MLEQKRTGRSLHSSHDESTKILGGHFTPNNLQAISQQDKHFHTKDKQSNRHGLTSYLLTNLTLPLKSESVLDCQPRSSLDKSNHVWHFRDLSPCNGYYLKVTDPQLDHNMIINFKHLINQQNSFISSHATEEYIYISFN